MLKTLFDNSQLLTNQFLRPNSYFTVIAKFQNRNRTILTFTKLATVYKTLDLRKFSKEMYNITVCLMPLNNYNYFFLKFIICKFNLAVIRHALLNASTLTFSIGTVEHFAPCQSVATIYHRKCT